MKIIGNGDMVYVFMGESLLHVKVNSIQDSLRIESEDEHNTYCFYIKDCYLTKEEAIEGMLNAISQITDCDCGEDESRINNLKKKEQSYLNWLDNL